MIFHCISLSAKFTKYCYPVIFNPGQGWPRIYMDIVHITYPFVDPSTCLVYQSGRIQVFRIFNNFFRIELTPAFIERHPNYYTRMVIKGTDHSFILFPVFRLRFLTSFNFFRLIASIGHILPHKYSHFIAPIVKSLWLYLYMFSQHIKTQSFGYLYIIP